MSYERMRVLCMFDLPMETAKEKKDYREFRKLLLENGFTMLQYSIYQRAVPNRQATKKYERILKKKIPVNGEIRLMYITEKQFNDMDLLIGSRSKQEEIVGDNKLVAI